MTIQHRLDPGDVIEVEVGIDRQRDFFVCICISYDFFLGLSKDIPFRHEHCEIDELKNADVDGCTLVDLRSLRTITKTDLQRALSRPNSVKCNLSADARKKIIQAAGRAKTLSKDHKDYLESRLLSAPELLYDAPELDEAQQ